MSQDRIPVVSIVGHHDSGKTTLIANLLPVLVARGLRVGTVKHAPHLAALDASRSDSARHFEAGASRVLLLGEDTSALFWAHDDSPLSADIDRLFAGCDLVLIEGGKTHPYPRIEVFRRGRELTREPLAGQIDVACVITDERVALPDGLAVIPPRDLERIADLVEQLAFEI
jgi:molybdopterin-guanine dinucleotide biosynthesis protein B